MTDESISWAEEMLPLLSDPDFEANAMHHLSWLVEHSTGVSVAVGSLIDSVTELLGCAHD